MSLKLPINKRKKAPTRYFVSEQDMDFLRATLPHGLTKSPLYYKCGGKYTTVLLVYKYPPYMDDLLFASLFNSIDATISLDITKKTRREQVQDVAQSLEELYSRQIVNTKVSENLDDRYEMEDMTQLHRDLQKGNEQIATGTLRLYISADSEKELREKVDAIKKELEIYSILTTVPENEMLQEYAALQDTADTVRQAFPIYQTLSRQYPFWHQSHKDPHGLLFGITTTGGQVVLDPFLVSNDRKSFDMLFTGKKGAGKSAALKSMIQDMVALGHKVMAIDVEGEMQQLAEKLGGVVLRPSSHQARINPLQLRQMFSRKYDDDLMIGNEEDRSNNYVAEMSRIMGFFYQYIPSLSDIEADELKTILDRTYDRFGINDTTDLTQRRQVDFPILSDVLSTLRSVLYINCETKQYQPNLSSARITLLEKLEAYLKPLAEGSYASLFNGATTVDFQEEYLVIFDIASVGEMDDRVYNAYMFNILGLMWGEIYRNRELNAHLKNEENRHYCISVIDEAHKILNVHNPQGLEFMEKLVRRSRKYDAAIWFASQSPRDFAPSSDVAEMDRIKNIFTLVQYKCLLQQDESDTGLLQKLFPVFTDSELISTTVYGKGEMLLSIGNGQKIRCKRYIPPEDFEYFGGGR